MPRKKTAAKTAAANKKTTAKAPEVGPEPSLPSGACPRCGTTKFSPEPRIRTEGDRTVRFTILVCERGHTFARPRSA